MFEREKKYLIAAFLLCLTLPLGLFAQQEEVMTVRAIVSSGNTQQNVYAVIGQPFYRQISNDRYEIAYGVAQAQLETRADTAATCVNEPYHNDLCFDIPAEELTVGVTDYEKYESNVDALLGYDLLCKLNLSVWPIYAFSETKMFHGELPVIDGSLLKDGVDYQIVEGINVLNFFSIHGCDSVVTLNALLCPLTTTDADQNDYNTVVLDNFCWTQTNMKTTHYDNDQRTPIEKALIYKSLMHPDEVENENIYGRLYTWYSAVGIPEDSDEMLNADGFVQGICPAGWHIPAAPEVAAYSNHDAYDLRSSELWVQGAGNNSTGFTLLPAGWYLSSSRRFQEMLTDTRLWFTATNANNALVPGAINVPYHCDSPIILNPLAADAYSVRCVQDYDRATVRD